MAESSEVACYTSAVAAAVDTVFGERLVGVWLVGSRAYGGANASSDIDIQACVREAAPDEITELARRIAHPNLPCPAVGLEFVLHDADRLASPTVPLQWLLNLNGGPDREHKMSTDPSSESWHWFVLDLAIGRETARTLAGRSLAEIVPPFDRHVLVEAIAQSQRWHHELDHGSPNQLANAARGLRFLQTGEWGSKPEGLAWAGSAGIDRSEIVEQLSKVLRREGMTL